MLADFEGPAAIQHLWMTADPRTWRQLVLRFYWDGEATTSVEVPVGDLFYNGWCVRSGGAATRCCPCRSIPWGKDLFGTGGPQLERRLGTPPGLHGRKMRRREREYARQLREKQRVKCMYGMREAQFRRFFAPALRSHQLTGMALLKLLERRLENVVYQLGFARTRLQSRQLAGHGHVSVDGQRVDIPSYFVRPGQEVTISETALQMADIQALAESQPLVPEWLERRAGGGVIVREPEREEMDQDINEAAIVEFYSR